MTMFKIVDLDQGQEISHEGRSVTIGIEATESKGEIHIGNADTTVTPARCPILGNTYKHKETIKKLPYGADGVEWTGDVWVVNKDMVSSLVTELLWLGVGVTVESSHIQASGMDLKLKAPPTDDDESPKVERVWQGPISDEKYVSEAWADTAARMGNFNSVDRFAHRFGLTVMSDEEMIELLESNGAEPEYREVYRYRMDRL